MSTHNICFHREKRKISAFFRWKKRLICCYVADHHYYRWIICKCKAEKSIITCSASIIRDRNSGIITTIKIQQFNNENNTCKNPKLQKHTIFLSEANLTDITLVLNMPCHCKQCRFWWEANWPWSSLFATQMRICINNQDQLIWLADS